MANLNEEKIREKYEKLGYKVLHKGCPDFLIFKYDKKTKKFSDIQFIEVKFGGDRLSYEQAVYKKVLKSLRLNYKLIHIPSLKEAQTNQDKPKQDNSIQFNSIQGKAIQAQPTQLNTKQEVKQNGTESKT